MRGGGNWLPFLLIMVLLFMAVIGTGKLISYLRHKYKQRRALSE